MDLVPVLFGHPPFTAFYQPPCRNAAHVAALAFARHVLALVEEDYVVTAHQAVTAAALTMHCISTRSNLHCISTSSNLH